MSRLSKGIRNLRTMWRKSIQDVALEIGVSDEEFDSWEKGKTEPNASQLKKLSKLFNVTIEYIVTGKASDLDSKTIKKPLTQQHVLDDYKEWLSKILSKEVYDKYNDIILNLIIQGKKKTRAEKVITVEQILPYNDFDLFDQLHKANLFVSNSWNIIRDLVRHSISDIKFYEFAIKKIENKNELLTPFLKGTLPWNTKIIEMLIKNGAMVEKFFGRYDNSDNPLFENDVFATLLLKEYCEKYNS